MNFKNTLRYISALAVVVVAGYFFYLQFKNNADVLNAYDFSLNSYYIFLSIVFGTFALLIGPIVWRMYVNNYLQKKLNFTESYALYCTSAVFKYIPGKVWTYAAQIALMSSKGISKVVLLYINMVSFICLVFVAAMFSLYYFFCMKAASWGVSAFMFISLIVLDIVFIVWNNSIINYLIVPVNRIFKVEIQPIKTKKIIFIYTQMLYFLACIFLGTALYFLARGMNMGVPFTNIFAIMATISISLILGLIAFFSVGGLGVREGTMFVMLKQFSNIEVALILPVVARMLTIIVELSMLIIAIFIGMKYGYFHELTKSRQKGENEADN